MWSTFGIEYANRAWIYCGHGVGFRRLVSEQGRTGIDDWSKCEAEVCDCYAVACTGQKTAAYLGRDLDGISQILWSFRAHL
jgi:hypothetical protein